MQQKNQMKLSTLKITVINLDEWNFPFQNNYQARPILKFEIPIKYVREIKRRHKYCTENGLKLDKKNVCSSTEGYRAGDIEPNKNKKRRTDPQMRNNEL